MSFEFNIPKCFPLLHQIYHIYIVSDVIECRSGSWGTEIVVVGLIKAKKKADNIRDRRCWSDKVHESGAVV